MRKISFTYNLLDKNNNFKKTLFNVESCTITYSSLSTLKYTANLTMTEDTQIDWLNGRIQVFCTLNGVTYPLGIYIISAPNLVTKDTKVIREVVMYSPIILLQRDKVQTRHFIQKGSNVIQEIKRLIGSISNDIEEATYYTSADKEYEIGTEKIEIINDLLKSINYTSLYPRMDGTLVAKKYVLPDLREVQIKYLEGFDSILFKDRTEIKNLFDVHNVFIRYTNNADINPPLIARYENVNPDSPTSTVNTSINVDAKEISDVTDLAVLQDIAKKDCYEESQIYSNLEFSTAINPLHGYLNCIYLKYGDIDNNYIETSWQLECKVGGRMMHKARRVVAI